MAYKVTYKVGDKIATAYLIAMLPSRYDNPLTFWYNIGLDLKRNIIEIEKFGEPFMEVF